MLPGANSPVMQKGALTRAFASGGRVRAFKLSALVVLVLLAAWLAEDFLRHIHTVEGWISGQGWMGVVAFVLVVVVFTSIFVPDTVFAVIAGVLFGALWGTVVMTVAALITAALDFALARHWFHAAVTRALQSRPKLAAVQNAVQREGWRFQLLLRLTPLNPVSLNYILGASSTPVGPFLVSCVGMIPGLAMETYFGHAAHHVANLAAGTGHTSTLHTVLTIGGLVACVVVMLYLTRLAKRAIAVSGQAA